MLSMYNNSIRNMEFTFSKTGSTSASSKYECPRFRGTLYFDKTKIAPFTLWEKPEMVSISTQTENEIILTESDSSSEEEEEEVPREIPKHIFNKKVSAVPKPVPTDISSYIDDDFSALEKYAKNTNVTTPNTPPPWRVTKERVTKERKCKDCKKTGHDRRNCPTKQ
jgi:hypothetical protein